jgi:hypothetical protein
MPEIGYVTIDSFVLRIECSTGRMLVVSVQGELDCKYNDDSESKSNGFLNNTCDLDVAEVGQW